MASFVTANWATSSMKKITFEDLILFENSDFLVINKPPYLSSLDDRHEAQNILDLAKTYWEDAQLCHRLDKETSGCLVIAKNPEAYRHLAMQFENRQVEKIYHAVVEGIQDFQSLLVDRNLAANNKGIAKVSKDGKPAQTVVHTLKTYFAHSLLSCSPITGRLHQIRVHLASQGHPIAGDDKYGDFEWNKALTKQGLKRMFLHAWRLQFTHPTTGKRLELKSNLPEELQQFTNHAKPKPSTPSV